MEHGNVWKAGEFEGNQTVNNTKQMDAWQPFSKIKLKLHFFKKKNKTLLLIRDYQDMSFNLKNNRNYKTKCGQSMKVNLSNWNSGTRSALTRIEHFFPVKSNVTGIGGCWRLWQLQNNHCRFVATVHRFLPLCAYCTTTVCRVWIRTCWNVGDFSVLTPWCWKTDDIGLWFTP